MVDLDKNIFGFIFNESMDEAVNQKAYKGKKKQLKNLCDYESLEDELSKIIRNVLNGNYERQEVYDAGFIETTINICNIINQKEGNNKFTFGNAQKLINMMMKYFYITCYGNKAAKDKFKFCHCPMDQQLLKKVWDVRVNLRHKHNIELGKYVDFMKSWGNEDFKDCSYPDRYILFQEAVRVLAQEKGISPLEFDYNVWNR